MQTPFKTQNNLEDIDSEVRSYIFQVLMELEPYTTPDTIVSVIAKDPLKLIRHYESEGTEYDSKALKKMHRISIALADDGVKIEEEALHEDIFGAIRLAKDKLVSTLAEIQDKVISNQDRAIQINTILKTGSVH